MNNFASAGIPKRQRTLKDELAEIKVNARRTKHRPNYIVVSKELRAKLAEMRK